MVANLVRKDFLLVKKMAAAFLAVSILVPIILMVNAAQMAGIEIISCLYMVILTEILFMQSVAMEEEKSPKAVALLCAAPYSQKSYIIARYLCYLIFYGASLAIYSVIAAVYPRFNFLNVTEALTVFLISTVLYGIYTPIMIKYGATKGQLVISAAILLVSMGPTFLVRLFHPDLHHIIEFLQGSSNLMTAIVVGISGVVIFTLSMILSIRIFSRKEL